MTAFNAKPHEVRAMLSSGEFCAVRPLKPQPPKRIINVQDITEPCQDDETGEWGQRETIWSHWTLESRGEPLHEKWHPLRLPFSPGDVVTVKETFARVVTYKGPSESVVFRADSRDSSGAYWHEVAADPTGVTWSRPQNMRPEWSRLTLTVESVSVKRVQDVTEEEARLAGAPEKMVTSVTDFIDGTEAGKPSFVCGLWSIWSEHNPKTPWDANPWVCVARAKVHHCNVKEMKGEAA